MRTRNYINCINLSNFFCHCLTGFNSRRNSVNIALNHYIHKT